MAKFLYFELDEFVKSDVAKRRGIDNTPTFETVDHLAELVSVFLNPLRIALGKPIVVTSGYRSPSLNRAVGGSATSLHMKGYAADIYCPRLTFPEFQRFVLDWVKKTGTRFDQIILERNTATGAQWLHVGLYSNNGTQRGQILSMSV